MHAYRPRRKRTKAVCLDELVVLFPGAFKPAGVKPVPLKVGIYADVKRADPDWRPRDVQAAVAAYVSSISYLRCLVAGAPRVGLDGSCVGIVSDEHAEHASRQLREKIAAKVRSKAQPAPPPTRPPRQSPAQARQRPPPTKTRLPSSKPGFRTRSRNSPRIGE